MVGSKSELIRPSLIFSKAVLEHVGSLEETYQAMCSWLNARGYVAHLVDFRDHGRSPFWDGHRAYSDRQRELAWGKREFLLNQETLSTHPVLAKKMDFELRLTKRDQVPHGLDAPPLSLRFSKMSELDALTIGVLLVFQKPKSVQTVGK